MAQSSDLALMDTGIKPSAVIAMATEQANALMEIVEARKLYQDIKGKRYLTADAWETIGAFNSVHAVTQSVTGIYDRDDEEVIAYQATVHLMQHGIIVGSGISMCGLDEFVTQSKKGIAAHRAAMSAAQTWAASKAYRLNYSWVAVMAGFEPTPAEEMQDTPETSPVQTSAVSRPSPQGEMLLSNIRSAADFNAYYLKKGWTVDDLMAVTKAEDGMTPGQALSFWAKNNGSDFRELALQMEYYVANMKHGPSESES